MIDEFATSVSSKLSFDPDLASRLKHEISDHLHEALGASNKSGADSAALAIKRFGNTDSLVAEFVRISLIRRARIVKYTTLFAIVFVFATMRIRSLITSPDSMETLFSSLPGNLVMIVDRYAFLFAILVILGNWLFEMAHSRKDLMRDENNNSYKVSLFVLSVGAVLIVMSALSGVLSFIGGAPSILLYSKDVGYMICIVISLFLIIVSSLVSVQTYNLVFQFIKSREAISI